MLPAVGVDVVCLLDDAEVRSVLSRMERVGSDKVPCREETAVEGVDVKAGAGDVCAECGH